MSLLILADYCTLMFQVTTAPEQRLVIQLKLGGLFSSFTGVLVKPAHNTTLAPRAAQISLFRVCHCPLTNSRSRFTSAF